MYLQEFRKDKIIYKFGNARKSLDKDHPDVKLRKRPKAEEKTPAALHNHTLTWGLQQFLPENLASEDDVSSSLYIKWLQRELKKSVADIDVTSVDMKMALTFPRRRKSIVVDKMDIKEILEIYPWLQSRQEARCYFE